MTDASAETAALMASSTAEAVALPSQSGQDPDPNELVVALGKQIADLNYALQKEHAEHELAKAALANQDEPLYKEVARLDAELTKVEKELIGVKADCRKQLQVSETEKFTTIQELSESLETSENRKKTLQTESKRLKKDLDDLRESYTQVLNERDDLQKLVEKMKLHQRELVMRPSADADKLRKADLRIEELDLELADVRTREIEGKQALNQAQEEVQELDQALK